MRAKFINDFKLFLETITNQKWDEDVLFDKDITIYNDNLNVEIDLLFDINKLRICNYNTNQKDKIILEWVFDQNLENYIKQFLKEQK